jgi:hypothetical protein
VAQKRAAEIQPPNDCQVRSRLNLLGSASKMFSVKFFDPTVMTEGSFAQDAKSVSERTRKNFKIDMKAILSTRNSIYLIK